MSIQTAEATHDHADIQLSQHLQHCVIGKPFALLVAGKNKVR
jgi:hypothetical protein